MRRWWICVWISAIMLWDGATAFAGNTTVVVTDKTSTDYIATIYKKINFCPGGRLDSFVFAQAYRGYINLRRAGKLNEDRQLLTICDFSLSSNTNRLWIIDLKDNKVLYNTYVAHGQGSGEEFATAFSNRENSHQSSLGFYVTGETYNGEHGTSLRLNGMDNGYNDAALERSIVLHGAAYVCNDFIKGNNRLGRSWGCPAVDATLAPEIIDQVKDGTCLFIYYPDKKYQSSSCWLQQRTKPLQQNAAEQFLLRVPEQPLPAETQDMVTR